MPDNNSLSANGLTVNSVTDIVTNLTQAFQSIYGAQINVSANSPDGQIIGILAQAISDNLQLLMQVYNSFSIVSAFGTTLDQRVAISGIVRNQGTYTNAYVVVTASTALTLPGTDVLAANPSATVFTVADQAGNQYQLQTSYSFAGAGSQSLLFVCETIGAVQTTPNTITIIYTPIPGVVSVNNPTTASDVQGVAEETDPQLKIRQANSYFLQSQAPADAIRAALLNTPGIIDAYVPENDTGSPVNGVPAYGIWVIVNPGTVPASTIAQTIYVKKNAGCAMTGAQSYNVVRPQGNTATMFWDNAVSQPLYVQATLYPRIPGLVFDTTADAATLAAALVYMLGQSPNSGDIVLAMLTIEPNAIVANAEVSVDGSTWEQIVTPSSLKNYFLSTAANITLTNA